MALAAALACQELYVKVGKARLADADGVVPAPPGPTMEVMAGDGSPAGAQLGPGPVRLAIDRDATWGEAMRVIESVRNAGGEPALLVSHQRKVVALPAPVAVVEESILLDARSDGRACVSPPRVADAACVARRGTNHVDRAFVRELVRQAVKTYDLPRVHVRVASNLSFADAVRAIDGARTCCFQRVVEVSVEGL